MDFLEIMDFVAYDLELAHKMIEEAKSRMDAEKKKKKEQAESGIDTVIIVLI